LSDFCSKKREGCLDTHDTGHTRPAFSAGTEGRQPNDLARAVEQRAAGTAWVNVDIRHDGVRLDLLTMPHTIMSDININPGSSGGPLFNSAGQVIGFDDLRYPAGEGGPGCVRYRAYRGSPRASRAESDKSHGYPTARSAILPIEPVTPYPVEGLKEALRRKNTIRALIISLLEIQYRSFPHRPWDYREQEDRRLQAEREHKKRNKKQQSADEECRRFRCA